MTTPLSTDDLARLAELLAERARLMALPIEDCTEDNIYALDQVSVTLIESMPSLLAMARDGLRYRWLREQSHPWGKVWYSLGALDAAIDAAKERAP